MQILQITNTRTRRTAVAAAVKILRSGGVVAHPTDTVFGLAADVSSPKAIQKIHAIKKSNTKKPLLVVVPTKHYLTQLAKVPQIAKVLIKEFWPGALALVLERKSPRLQQAGDSETVGVRYPDHALTLALARGLKAPIVTTSANPTGRSPVRSAAAVFQQFARQKHQPDLILDDYKAPKVAKPSTIIDCTGLVPTLLRTGVVPASEIQRALRHQSQGQVQLNQR